jgi:hypothetical protein
METSMPGISGIVSGRVALPRGIRVPSLLFGGAFVASAAALPGIALIFVGIPVVFAGSTPFLDGLPFATTLLTFYTLLFVAYDSVISIDLTVVGVYPALPNFLVLFELLNTSCHLLIVVEYYI